VLEDGRFATTLLIGPIESSSMSCTTRRSWLSISAHSTTSMRTLRQVGDVVFKVGEYPYEVAEQDALELARRVRKQAGDDPLSDAISAAVYIEQAVHEPAEIQYPDAMPEELRYVRQALDDWGMTPAGYESMPESLRSLRLALHADETEG
jgi:hypothetical protein